jgi:hypothetical protein
MPSPNWPRQQTNPRMLAWGFIMERVTRIELALSAWEADVLPLNYTRERRRGAGVGTRRHFTSCRAPRAEGVGSGVVCGVGTGLRGAGVGAYGGGAEEGLGGARRGPGRRLESRLVHPVMWLSSSGRSSGRRQAGRQVDFRPVVGLASGRHSGAALGEGTLGLDGAHRRPLCRWARVQHSFVPDAAGRSPRPWSADALSALCPAAQCRAGADAGGVGQAVVAGNGRVAAVRAT